MGLSIKGIDYAWGRPAPKTIAAYGARFVGRYSTRDTTGKALTAAESVALSAHGLSIVLFFEDSAGRAFGTSADGRLDARFAATQALECGQPVTDPIYAVCDQSTAGHPEKTNAYFDGWASEIGRERTRGYGDAQLVNHLYARGLGKGIETVAWSDGIVSSEAVILQDGHTVTLDGVVCDTDLGDSGYQIGWKHSTPTGITHAEWLKLWDFLPTHWHHAPWGSVWADLVAHPSVARHVIDTMHLA